MWQQGQVFKLKAKGVDGQPRGVLVPDRGARLSETAGRRFATPAEALKRLRRCSRGSVPVGARRR
jgi:hypothetical protein